MSGAYYVWLLHYKKKGMYVSAAGTRSGADPTVVLPCFAGNLLDDGGTPPS